jgi:hypothetical protein
MRSERQLIATHGNGFGLFLRVSGSQHLPPVDLAKQRLDPGRRVRWDEPRLEPWHVWAHIGEFRNHLAIHQ